ncbi:MAG: hypothetical protein U5J96_05535 [Ignavibacteriaceae bacterium]|nr:hypothetical protein [Ignavibacteriaceae bacterium]
MLIARGDLEESIREEFLSWDRPITANLSINFFAQKGSFGIGEEILDNWSLYLRGFYQSGKRYTPAVYTGSIDEDGRKEYEFVQGERYAEIADDWFYIDLNFEKYFDLSGLSFSIFLEVNNILDNQNSTIINPVTGRAYEYGDDVPSSYNDPRYPDVQAPILPYPLNPARYLTKRNLKFGVTFNF